MASNIAEVHGQKREAGRNGEAMKQDRLDKAMLSN